MAGPGIKHDERIYGANLLNVAPTVLTLLGLPVGEDMAGPPLLQAFETPARGGDGSVLGRHRRTLWPA